MVWIHGGGVVDGASTYDGLPLSAHENVVVVTIQYRLGIWGLFRWDTQHSFLHISPWVRVLSVTAANGTGYVTT